MLNLLTLDEKGVALAVIFGVLILVLGGAWQGVFFLAVMLVFLAVSAAVTWLGKRKKEGIGLYEHARGWKNVLSNGIVPVGIAAGYYLNGIAGTSVSPTLITMLYIASVAAVTADKFSSEVGVLDGEPTMLLTLKRVKKGMSGGVTALGLGASLLGALIIGLSAFYVSLSIGLIAILTLSGFAGSLVDSVFGYYEEKGVGNKYTSNFICSVAGTLVCFALLAL